MDLQEVAFITFSRERVDARIAPDVAPVASVFAQLDVVAMRGASITLHQPHAEFCRTDSRL